MGSQRNVGLLRAIQYKGEDPYLSFILHRIGGLGMAIFVTVHLLSTFLGGPVGQFLNAVYMHWSFQIFIFFCVLFHAINGLRITILDLWPQLIPFQRQALWVEWVVFFVVYGFAVYVIASTAVGG